MKAIKIITEKFPIIYNELDGEGVSYQIIKETINGYNSFKINHQDDVSSLLPDEAYFLFGTYDISFISDLVSCHYETSHHNIHSQILHTTQGVEEYNKKPTKPFSKLMRRRMFNGGLFEASCVYACLDKNEKERITNMLNNTKNCEDYAWDCKL